MDFRAIWLGTSWTGGRVVGKTPAGVLDCEAARQGEGQQARVNAHAECAGTMEWTGGRVVEGARLESVYTGDRIAGSNPALSAMYFWKLFFGQFLAISKTLGFLCFTRLCPDVRMRKFGLFILK